MKMKKYRVDVSFGNRIRYPFLYDNFLKTLVDEDITSKLVKEALQDFAHTFVMPEGKRRFDINDSNLLENMAAYFDCSKNMVITFALLHRVWE